ncbi:hypothetical protein AB0C98_23725 [Streptomyces sp. NPDC048558]|uniref:hypothetical protein n=1 Tax=Streptomyces sp. NPDC048558 TaxID=3155759 RepID=UPI00343E27BF
MGILAGLIILLPPVLGVLQVDLWRRLKVIRVSLATYTWGAVMLSPYSAWIAHGLNIWHSDAALALSLPVMYGGYYAAHHSSKRDVWRDQKRRNVEASATLKRILAGEPHVAITLYLRAFMTEDRFSAQPLMRGDGIASHNDHLDLEELLRRALYPHSQLMGVGNWGALSGSAQVRAQSADWKKLVDLLIREAELLIIVPSAQPGTFWELQQIRYRKKLRKTIFIMPENSARSPRMEYAENQYFGKPFIRRTNPGMHILNHQAEWQRVAVEAAKTGIHLPQYQRTGAAFTLGEDGNVSKLLPLNIIPHARRKRRLQWLIAELGVLSRSNTNAQ